VLSIVSCNVKKLLVSIFIINLYSTIAVFLAIEFIFHKKQIRKKRVHAHVNPKFPVNTEHREFTSIKFVICILFDPTQQNKKNNYFVSQRKKERKQNKAKP